MFEKMKNILLLAMSIFSILFGCTSKKTPKKVEEWPRFPATDNSEITVAAVPLADGFRFNSFFIAPDKQNTYVLAYRISENTSGQKQGRNRPGEPDYMDYRLLCLDARGLVKYQKELPGIDWIYGGTIGLLNGELMLRLGDWLLVLDPKSFNTLEKIPVHDPTYVPWKETEMTRDEQQADYQAKFDTMLSTCKACNWLYWSPTQEYMVFVQGVAGERSAWLPISDEEDLLTSLKQRFEPLSVTLNRQVSKGDSNLIELADALGQIREVELLSAGTQLDYPNYLSRSVLQYELTTNGKKAHFSTTDKDRHSLRLGFSDNLMVSLADGSVWVMYEGVLFRIQ